VSGVVNKHTCTRCRKHASRMATLFKSSCSRSHWIRTR